jgi:hypothetical protein
VKSYQSTSTVQPEEWDKTSSAEKVYHNKNVTEVPATDENPLMYQYDVDEYEKLEYLQMQNEELQRQNNQLQEVIDTMLGGNAV